MTAAEKKQIRELAEQYAPKDITPIVVRNRNNESLKKLLKKHNACREAIRWVGTKDLKKALQNITKAYWLTYILGEVVYANSKKKTWGGAEAYVRIEEKIREIRSEAHYDASLFLFGWSQRKYFEALLWKKFYVVR